MLLMMMMMMILKTNKKSKNNTNKLSNIKQILPSTFYQLLVFSWDFW